MLESGKILQERYKVERQIGQGGMGSVYLATDTRFNSTVAIKETLVSDENFQKALMREARLLNSLKHVALPKVSDHFVEDKGQYIVMEYITGDDLYETMERTGEAFPIEDVKVWAEQLLDALEYLHGQENPIIHRDIKPQNLKLTPQGQIILLDFGLAKGNPTDANYHTAANSIFGYSRHYASLEQIQGTGTDPRSDIYSLAATLYHLVTGKAPADALTRVMNVMNEDRDPLQPANLLHEQVDGRFSLALDRCMSLNANLRPQSAHEMYELFFDEAKPIPVLKTRSSESRGPATAFSSMNTRIKPGPGEDSEARTQLMEPRGGEDSVDTKIADRQTRGGAADGTRLPRGVTNSRSGRNTLFKVGAVIGLLLVGTGAALFYLDAWSPSKVPTDAVLPVPEMEKALPAKPDPRADEGKNAPEQASNEPTPKDSPATAADPGSTKRTAAVDTQRANEPMVARAPTKKELEQLKAMEKELGTDFNFTVKEGKIFSDNFVIDDEGVMIRPLKPGEPPVRLPGSREEFRKLSPEDRKKLRDAIEMRRRFDQRQQKTRVLPVQPPPPPPSPQPTGNGSQQVSNG